MRTKLALDLVKEDGMFKIDNSLEEQREEIRSELKIRELAQLLRKRTKDKPLKPIFSDWTRKAYISPIEKQYFSDFLREDENNTAVYLEIREKILQMASESNEYLSFDSLTLIRSFDEDSI